MVKQFKLALLRIPPFVVFCVVLAAIGLSAQGRVPIYSGGGGSIAANNVQAGTFGAGNFTFPDDVTSDNFVIDNSVSGRGFYFGSTGGNGLVYEAVSFDRVGASFRGGATTRPGPLGFAYPTKSDTAGQTLTEAKGGITFYSNDADGQAFVLPNDPLDMGTVWRFLVRQTQTSNSLSIAPSAGETLRYNNSTCSTLTSTVRDSYAEVMTTTTGAGGNFTVLHNQGTWVCNP